MTITDGAAGGAGSGPGNYVKDSYTRMGILWMRTVDSWVDAEVVDCGRQVLTKRYLPYYGRDQETTEPLK